MPTHRWPLSRGHGKLLYVPRESAAEFFAWLDEPARVLPAMRRLAAAEPFDGS